MDFREKKKVERTTEVELTIGELHEAVVAYIKGRASGFEMPEGAEVKVGFIYTHGGPNSSDDWKDIPTGFRLVIRENL